MPTYEEVDGEYVETTPHLEALKDEEGSEPHIEHETTLERSIASLSGAKIDGIPVNQYRTSFYLLPHELTPNEANEKARPAESAEARQKRVEEMAESIRAVGQEYPVLVIEVDDGDAVHYEYVDGGCRVDALNLLNSHADEPIYKVWCSLLDPNEDLFRTAVTANIRRTQNSILDMAYIVKEAMDRNGWKGRGAQARCAEYLGIGPNRVAEYLKLLRASPEVKGKITSGEITGLDTALALLNVPSEKQVAVAARAKEIAEADLKEEEDERPKRRNKPKADAGGSDRADRDDTSDPNPSPLKSESGTGSENNSGGEVKGSSEEAPASRPAKRAKVRPVHVKKAAREAGVEAKTSSKRGRSEILEFFEKITPAAYAPNVVRFCERFIEWANDGSKTDRSIIGEFDKMLKGAVGEDGPKPKKAPAKKAVKKAKGKKDVKQK